MFNLNMSQKPEVELAGKHIHEMINMYGIPCKWLFSERVNEDNLVFKDFSHMKVGTDFMDVTLKPEETESYIGDNIYNGFGIFNQQSTELFISAIDMLRLYPEWFTETGSRAKVVNSLIITPSSTILEITNVENFFEGISNLWGYDDKPNSYRLSCKVYSNNISDEGVSDIKDTIKLEEGPDGEIFSHDQDIDTSEVDAFFDTLSDVKVQQDKEGDEISSTGGVFGNLS